MKKQKLLSKIFIASIALVASATTFMIPSIIETSSALSKTSKEENVSITNASFDATTASYARNSVSGWSRIKADGSATTMIIDTNKNFSTNKSSPYYLSTDEVLTSANPNDNKIAMINSATSFGQKDGLANEGFRSDEIELSENSFYYFEVSMKTLSFNDEYSAGSFYVSGLKDEDNNNVKLAIERQTAETWTKYYLFLATGENSQKITFDLWLGSENFTSGGVVFFDEVYGKKFSENAYYQYLNTTLLLGTNRVQSVDLRDTSNIIDTTGYNFDFEEDVSSIPSGLSKWETIDEKSNYSTAHARQFMLNAENYFEDQTGRSFPGSNFSSNNNQSLVLWTDGESNIAVQSNEIEIKAHDYYKITAYVKTDINSGSFYMTAVEQDTIFTNFPSLEGSYNLHKNSSGIAISSTSGSEFDNDYQIVTLFVEGNQLYDSAFKLELALGSNDSKANGLAIVDDIRIERISPNEYSEGENKVSFAFTSNSDKKIKNTMFNNISGDEILTYPLKPANFEVESDNGNFAGVINTYSTYFASYATETWGEVANPARLDYAPANENRSNNVFMFANVSVGHQSLKAGDVIELDNNAYFGIKFDYATYSSPLTLEIYDEDGILLFKDSNIYTSNKWGKYSCYIHTGTTKQKIYPKISLGTEENEVSGYAFIDNIEFETSTEDAYTASSNRIDLTGFMLNLDPEGKVNSNLTDHEAFTGTLTSGTFGEGGIIVGQGNTVFKDQDDNPIDKDVELNNNVLVIRVNENSAYTLKSKFKFSLQDGYYLLKFRLLTNYLPNEEDLPTKDLDGNEIEYNFGVSVGFEGYENVKKLKSNDGWTEFSVIFKTESSDEAELVFTLTSDIKDLYTTAYLTDIVLEESTEEDFNGATNKEAYNKTLFTAGKTAEDSTPVEDEDSTDNTSATSSQDFNWLLIPSIIMAVAVVVAILGAVIRKIKLGKKGEQKPKEKYDRKETVDKSFVKKEALKRRDEELKLTEQKIKDLDKELETIEKEHKEFITASRKEHGGKITKEIEKQFKLYGSKRSKIVDKIANLNEQKETINSAEYLLSLEKKIATNSLKNKK